MYIYAVNWISVIYFQIKKIDLIEDVKSCDSYFLAITLPDSVKLCKLGCNTSYDFTTLHEPTYDTYVSITDFTSEQLVCACHSVFEDVKVSWFRWLGPVQYINISYVFSFNT